jgi:lysozyme
MEVYRMEKEGMAPELRAKLKGLLTQDESFRQFPYTDTIGNLTIGIGRNLIDRGISFNEALYLLDEDISYFHNKLSTHLPFFLKLTENRQIALINMCFTLGVQGFLNFRQMMLALECHDYERAAKEMLDSKWAQQVGQRSERLAHIMRTDTL